MLTACIPIMCKIGSAFSTPTSTLVSRLHQLTEGSIEARENLRSWWRTNYLVNGWHSVVDAKPRRRPTARPLFATSPNCDRAYRWCTFNTAWVAIWVCKASRLTAMRQSFSSWSTRPPTSSTYPSAPFISSQGTRARIPIAPPFIGWVVNRGKKLGVKPANGRLTLPHSCSKCMRAGKHGRDSSVSWISRLGNGLPKAFRLRKPPIKRPRLMPCVTTCAAPALWIDWYAVMSASAKPKWPCVPRLSPCKIKSRSLC